MAIGLETYQETTDTQPEMTMGDLVAKMRSSVIVDADVDRLTIKEEWFRWYHAVLLVAILAQVGIPLYAFAMIDVAAPPDKEPIPAWAIAIAVTLLGSAAYWCLCGLINTTQLVVSNHDMVRRLGPLPWPGSYALSADEIDQFYVAQEFRSERRYSPWDWDGCVSSEPVVQRMGFSLRYSKKVAYYRLWVKLRSGGKRQVSIPYESPFTPGVMEQLIERQLGISDRIVRDEYQGH